jgi:putative FmdB family regulatory protein
MPIYEFRCNQCQQITSMLMMHSARDREVICKFCQGKDLEKIMSSISVHKNLTSKLSSLDPRYDKLVDSAIKNTPEADPNRHLRKMKPFPD